LNPVYIAPHRKKTATERVAILRRYAWSSYPSYSGEVARLSFVAYAPILAMMDRIKRKQRTVYRRFVESGIEDIDAAFVESKRQSRLCIGSAAFRDTIDERYQALIEGSDSKEDVSFRREVRPYPVEDVMQSVSEVLGIDSGTLLSRQRDSLARPLAAKALCEYAGLTQREIADVFHLSSGGAVSKQLARLSTLAQKDKSVRRVQKDINRAIQKHR